MEVKMISGFLVGEKIEAVKDVGVVYGASNVEIKIPRGATFRIVSVRDDRCGVVSCDKNFSLKLEIDKESVGKGFKVVESFRVGELVEAESAVIFYEDVFTPVRFKKGEIVEVVNISRCEYLVKNGKDSFHWVDDDFVERNFRRVENGGVLQRDEKTILSGRTETKTDETNDGQWTFSEDEKAILRNLSEEYKWIARDENNKLFVYEVKPAKNHVLGVWQVYISFCKSLKYYNYLFKTIKWKDGEPCEFRKYI